MDFKEQLERLTKEEYLNDCVERDLLYSNARLEINQSELNSLRKKAIEAIDEYKRCKKIVFYYEEKIKALNKIL